MRPDLPTRAAGSWGRAAATVFAATAATAATAVASLARWQPPAVARLLGRSSAVVVCVPTRARAVAVTLDDGPHAELTPEVLHVLERHGARATFFFLGAGVTRHPGIAAAAASAGHEIGNHGWADSPAVLQSRTAFGRDLRRTADAVLAATGREPTFVRPGSGWFRPVHLREVRDAGWTLALGSVAVLDLRVSNVDREARFVADRLQPGAVVVLHEGGGDRAGVVPLLDRVLTAARDRGYRCVTLSELVAEADGPAQRPSGGGATSSRS
jgi:peptidoglycan/xylan/chitin deacetylase (PgdA/CDA1 family)